MRLYRFSHRKFANDLSGVGAKLYGGRWNPVGLPVLYTSEHISLGLLEVLANAGTLAELQQLQLVALELPADATIHELKLSALKPNWHRDFGYSQFLGGEILKASHALAIKCPSALVFNECNLLLNPLHPNYSKVQIEQVADFYFDDRLFKIR